MWKISFINSLINEKTRYYYWFKKEFKKPHTDTAVRNAEMDLQIDAKPVNIHWEITNVSHWTKFICISVDKNHLHYNLC